MSEVIRGSCLCGGVRYQLTPPLLYMGHCHCSICRRFSGAAFSTGVGVLREQFRLVAGDDLLGVYRHENRKDMVFCSRCGSSLLATTEWTDAPFLSVRAGTLDDDPGIRPQVHIWVGSKAPWDEIADDLPQVAEDGR